MSRATVTAFALSAAFMGASLATPALALEPKQCLPMAAMNEALRAEGQRTMVIGDRVALDNPTGRIRDTNVRRYVNTVTANADGSLGYQLEGDLPRAQVSTKVCVRAKLTNIQLLDATRPGVWRSAALGAGMETIMRQAEAVGARPMVVADTVFRDGSDERLGLKMIVNGNVPARSGIIYGRSASGSAFSVADLSALEYTSAGLQRAQGVGALALNAQ